MNLLIISNTKSTMTAEDIWNKILGRWHFCPPRLCSGRRYDRELARQAPPLPSAADSQTQTKTRPESWCGSPRETMSQNLGGCCHCCHLVMSCREMTHAGRVTPSHAVGIALFQRHNFSNTKDKISQSTVVQSCWVLKIYQTLFSSDHT